MFQFVQRPNHDYLTEHRIRRTRLVTKYGCCNIKFGNIKYHNHFAFLVEIRWYSVLLFIASGSWFTGIWFIFSLLWHWIAKSNGDLIGQNFTASHAHCIVNVNDLTMSFLYSLETQTTIGYGGRALSGHCPGTVAIIVVQSLIAVFINCFMCGVILAKISLPKKSEKTVTFSDAAVICLNKDRLCLVIQVVNLRKTLLTGSQIYGKLLRTTVTPDSETIILDQVGIDFAVDAGQDNLFFVCPLTLYHVIDKASPFYGMTADSLQQQNFELVVFLDWTAESTSSACQVWASFIPQDGDTASCCISRDKMGKYRVEFSNFSRTVPMTTPHCPLLSE
ncbi:ATP-sensitive inward rectifier potassium channel 1b [Oncorhynchus mykiss]|uniref:ATP-sensitive inward rectifier potassium channel 1b n=1 Tax=Oncorhynchus mykiss TaxID=8022 RepID=UPI0016322D4B|nr:ATP-sensitive inward rectifier potassium channel 1b [Oncorhynchus mykiss]